MLKDIISGIVPSQLIPRVRTQDGLRQYQLTTAGFVFIYGLLHLSLFMDGMVHHAFFTIEIATLFLYAFLPTNYTLRPVSLLKNRVYYLLGLTSLWLLQPSLLPVDLQTSLLFDQRKDLVIHVTKILNQAQIERILKDGGKVDEEFTEQNAYAMQMVTAMKCLAWMSVLFAGLMAVEAGFVWSRCKEIETKEMPSAEKEKRAAKAAKAAKAPKAAAATATKS